MMAGRIRDLLNTYSQVKAELARRSLREFIRQAWHVVEPARALIPAWHVDAIAGHLQAISEGRIRNLLVNVPPGHAKSLIVSVLWPAWQWIRIEEGAQWRGLFASYDGGLATRDSVRCRALMESQWYRETFRPAWKLAGDQNEKAYFQNTKSGFRISLSVGGRGTGFRGDAIVVDDPLNASTAIRRQRKWKIGGRAWPSATPPAPVTAAVSLRGHRKRSENVSISACNGSKAACRRPTGPPSSNTSTPPM